MKINTNNPFRMVLVIAGLMLAAAPAFAEQPSGKTLAGLPFTAQMAVSEAMGRDNSSYHATKTTNGYLSKVGSGGTARFGEDGATVSGWRLSLSAIGRGNELKAARPAAPEAKANRIEYHRGEVTEWYVSGPLGLEQGFTLARPPEVGGKGPLSLALRLPAEMKAKIAGNRTDVSFIDSGAAQAIKYGKLVAWDATGQSLAAWFELVGDGAAQTLQIRVDDGGAQYPVTIDPLAEIQKLTATDAAVNDSFGYSVSLGSSGDTALIGAYGKNSSTGAAYVFTRSGTTWYLQQELAFTGAAAGDRFGWSVSLSGDGGAALIGATGNNSGRGAAYLFTGIQLCGRLL
jgi:hypothetical protein